MLIVDAVPHRRSSERGVNEVTNIPEGRGRDRDPVRSHSGRRHRGRLHAWHSAVLRVGVTLGQPGEKKGYAAFNSQPNCTAYIRVVVICKRDNGGTMYYYGGSKSWGSTSTFDCDSNGTYNNWGSLYGRQTSGTA